MSKLSKEELLKILGDSIEEGRRNIRDLKGSLDISQDEFDERFHKLNQTEQQTREIIKLHFSDDWQQVKKDLGKFMKGKKVTEEFVEKWIKKMTETYRATSMDVWLFRRQLTQMLKEAGVEIRR